MDELKEIRRCDKEKQLERCTVTAPLVAEVVK
jgi:hypothetical protein